MQKYARIINKKTGLVEVGLGLNAEFYESIGMTLMLVQQSDIDGNWYLADKCPMKTDEQKKYEEKERIGNLKLTGADVERGIYQVIGMDFDDIFVHISELKPEGVDLKALKIELKANHFYRGNPYVDIVGELLGFTKTQLDNFFETNDPQCLKK